MQGVGAEGNQPVHFVMQHIDKSLQNPMTEEILKELFRNDYTPTETLLRNHGLTFLQAEQEQTAFCEKFHRLAGSRCLRTVSLRTSSC